ncbi:ISAs1 family transposase, partial [Escherichia coli]|uniref:ISAs1 family transposase n=1 Tax=Escherichia coli TaxID=562 RepID=UPI0029C4D41B
MVRVGRRPADDGTDRHHAYPDGISAGELRAAHPHRNRHNGEREKAQRRSLAEKLQQEGSEDGHGVVFPAELVRLLDRLEEEIRADRVSSESRAWLAQCGLTVEQLARQVEPEYTPASNTPYIIKENKMELKKLMEHISIIPDYRQAWKVEHKLSDILLLTICAVISGAEGWEDIEDFGETHPDSTMHSLVLGQIKTDEKSNEITAIPELLNMMDIKGKIITTDAMGCQKDIAEKIQKQGGDYLFAVKGNQGRLNKAFEEKFPLKELNNPEHD